MCAGGRRVRGPGAGSCPPGGCPLQVYLAQLNTGGPSEQMQASPGAVRRWVPPHPLARRAWRSAARVPELAGRAGHGSWSPCAPLGRTAPSALTKDAGPEE